MLLVLYFTPTSISRTKTKINKTQDSCFIQVLKKGNLMKKTNEVKQR